MKNKIFIALMTLITFFSSFGFLGAAQLDIPAGTLVKLRLDKELSSRTSKKGDMVRFSVVQAVKIASSTVIAGGALAQAQISEVRGPGKFGKNARIKLNFLFVKNKNGERVSIKLGEHAAKINKQEGYAIGASAGGFLLLGPIGLLGGLFVNGKHVEIPKGTEFFVEVSD